MAPTPKHAHALTISLPRDMTDGDFKAVIDVIQRSKNTLYWHVISELGENQKVHLHAGIIMKQEAPCTPGNFKFGTLLSSYEIKQMLSEFSNTCYCINNKTCTSNFWFSHYMDKEADHQVYASNIPENFADIQWAFTDIVCKKAANPEYEKWERDYCEEGREKPATAETVEKFFNYHFYVKRDYKIPAAINKLKDRYLFMVNFLNEDEEASVQPKKKQKKEKTRKCDHCKQPYAIEGDDWDPCCPDCWSQGWYA